MRKILEASQGVPLSNEKALMWDGSGAVPTGMLAASLFLPLNAGLKLLNHECLEHDGAGVFTTISVLDFVKLRYRMSLLMLKALFRSFTDVSQGHGHLCAMRLSAKPRDSR